MKKVFIVITSFFVFALLACSEETTTTSSQTTTTTEVATTTDDSVIREELLTKLEVFSAFVDGSTVLEMDMTTRMTLFMGGDQVQDIITDETMEIFMQLDRENHYFYNRIQSPMMGVIEEEVEIIGNDLVTRMAMDDSLMSDVLVSQTIPPIDDFEAYVGFSLTDEAMTMAPFRGRYEKLSTNEYRVRFSLNTLLNEESELFDELLGIGELFIETEEPVIFDVNYNFISDNQMRYNLVIDKTMIESETQIYIAMQASSTMTVPEDYVKKQINYSQFTIEGNWDRSTVYLTLDGNEDYEIKLFSEQDNYFRYELEEGYYIINDLSSYRAYFGEVDIDVYNSDFELISGDHIYAIPEDGVYYINFENLTESNIRMRPTIRKLNPETVGIPSNPILTALSPVTLEPGIEQLSLMFMTQTSKAGMLLIRDTTVGGSGYQPFYGVNHQSFEDSLFGTGIYSIFIMPARTIAAIQFEILENKGMTFEWEYLTQRALTWDFSRMPRYQFDEPTHILFTENETAQNIKFTIPDTTTISIQMLNYMSNCTYGNILIDLYDEDMNMIANNQVNTPLTLEAGTYILFINAGGITYDDNVGTLGIPHIYFMLYLEEITS